MFLVRLLVLKSVLCGVCSIECHLCDTVEGMGSEHISHISLVVFCEFHGPNNLSCLWYICSELS